MTEPDVALTDFALAVECAVLASRASRARVPDVWQRYGLRLLFGAAGVAALVGGLYHGFLLDAPSRVQQSVWLVIFAAAGLASLACWAIAAATLFSRRTARAVNLVGAVLFLVYLASALARIRSFVIVVLATSVAAAALLAVYVTSYLRHRHPAALSGLSGIALIFVGSAVQRSGLDIHPNFTHDALYHVIVGISLFLLYKGVPALQAGDSPHRVVVPANRVK